MLHEAAHFLACVVLKVKAEKIRFMPYGVNLVTENILNPVHAMIISASGPVVSGLIALFLSGCKRYYLHFFAISNLGVFALNVFPALPLDGGVFVKNMISYAKGYISAHRWSIELTRITAFVFCIFGIIFVILSKYNISLLVISSFLLYNLKEERKKLINLRHMIYTKEFDQSGRMLTVHSRAVMCKVKAITLADYFGYNFICHFFVYDGNMKLLGILEQGEIIDGILKYGTGVTVETLLLGGNNEYKG